LEATAKCKWDDVCRISSLICFKNLLRLEPGTVHT
jgi:hypothetical protein